MQNRTILNWLSWVEWSFNHPLYIQIRRYALLSFHLQANEMQIENNCDGERRLGAGECWTSDFETLMAQHNVRLKLQAIILKLSALLYWWCYLWPEEEGRKGRWMLLRNWICFCSLHSNVDFIFRERQGQCVRSEKFGFPRSRVTHGKSLKKASSPPILLVDKRCS